MVEGFKHTEVGLIPEDWDVKKIGECLLRNPDYGINAAAVPYNENLPVYLRITDITEDGKFSKKNLVSVNNISSSSYFLSDGDLVFARTGASVGKTYLYNRNDGKLVFAGFLIRVKANEEILLPDYLKYFTQTKKYWDWIAANSMRTGQPGINGNEYKELSIPLPPTKAEQTAIATALNDADALITALEKLIAKKKAIKQGAMQELLKPKDGWIETSILEIVGNKKEFFDDGDWIEAEHITTDGIRLIQTGNIGIGKYVEKESKKYIYEESFYKLKCKELKIGDLLICRLAEPAGRACVLKDIGDERVVTSVDVSIFRPDVKTSNRVFLSNLFSTSEWFSKVTERVGGTTHKRISRSALGKIPITIPGITEQNRIAEILSDMDSEIEALEQKLEKQKQIKQGMMQVLLTGKIRLM